MPSINDRIGSQNVIRVLSNASAPPTKLVNMNDVDTARKGEDGLVLVWDASTEKFVLSDKIDASTIIQTGISSISNDTNSSTATTGALTVAGGVGISKNLTLGAGFVAAGVATFTSDIDANASVEIFRDLRVSNNLSVTGLTTFTGITTTVGDLYVGGDLYLQDDLVLDNITGSSLKITGISSVTDLNVSGNANFTGVSTIGNVVGFTTFQNDVSFLDNKKLRFGGAATGASGSLHIYHDGSNGYIDDVAIGNLILRSSGFTFYSPSNESIITATPNADVKLFFDNVNRVETTNYGAKVTGILSATSITADNITLDEIDGGSY